ncbi:unnamed protein product [Ilex paraguariensis]|uniref:Uncharacterized protein n=1 Tax=Ilex paraguariensis TaxID=185542 RepID=A0ABC8TYI7_9AQUA
MACNSIITTAAVYKEYQAKLANVAGSEKAVSILKDALYVLGAGSSDFLQNYYVNPWLNRVYTPDQYSSYLIGIFSCFIKLLCIGILIQLNLSRSSLLKLDSE